MGNSGLRENGEIISDRSEAKEGIVHWNYWYWRFLSILTTCDQELVCEKLQRGQYWRKYGNLGRLIGFLSKKSWEICSLNFVVLHTKEKRKVFFQKKVLADVSWFCHQYQTLFLCVSVSSLQNEDKGIGQWFEICTSKCRLTQHYSPLVLDAHYDAGLTSCWLNGCKDIGAYDTNSDISDFA